MTSVCKGWSNFPQAITLCFKDSRQAFISLNTSVKLTCLDMAFILNSLKKKKYIKGIDNDYDLILYKKKSSFQIRAHTHTLTHNNIINNFI